MGEAWRIEDAVFVASAQVLQELSNLHLPHPQLSCHGPESVVFSWSGDHRNLYLTVTDCGIGVVLSSKEKIVARGVLPHPNLEPTASVFAALPSTPLLFTGKNEGNGI